MKHVRIVYHHMPHYRQGFLNAFSQLGYDVSVVIGDTDVVDGIHSAIVPGSMSVIKLRNIWVGKLLWQRGLVSSVFRDNVDVFVFLASPNFVSTWVAATVARLRGRRVIYWGHGFLKPEQRFKNIVRRIYFGIASAFYSYGYRSKVIARGLGFSGDQLYVGLNSLDVVKQKALRENIERQFADGSLKPQFQVDSSAPALKLLCVSRLTKEASYDVLLRALAVHDQTKIGAYELVVIGDGPCRGGLESLAADLQVNARFLGAIYDESVVARWFYEADVTISPGKIGLTAMHSLAYGTPVISHSELSLQMPEIEAVVPGETGLLFKYGDHEDLARVISNMRNLMGPRDQVRRKCIRVIEEFYNPDFQVKILSDAIEDVPAPEGDYMRSLGGGA